MKDQIRLKSIACSPALNGVLPDAMRIPGVATPLLSTRLNAPFFSAIVSVLGEANAMHDDVVPLVDRVIATYEAALANGLDVAQVPFRAAFWERTPLAWNDPTERQGSPFYRAPWPISEFDFMADGTHAIDFDLIARSARERAPQATQGGRVGVAVNGAQVADFDLALGWKHLRGRIPRSALRRAANRIRVSWTPLWKDGAKDGADEEANAIVRAKERFAAGANGELFPVFGEIFSFELRSVNA